MEKNVKAYRDHLYSERAHPGDEDRAQLVDYRDSFHRIYLSGVVFLFFEYLVETSIPFIPSALVFPTGYLLFWAFYYTYYEPSFLERNLYGRERWKLSEIPGLLLGVAIWFVKLTITEIQRPFVALLRPPPPPVVVRQRAAPESMMLVPRLPSELVGALEDLGLDEKACWNDIHQRYRDLAKRYHPDLNPEITGAGTRFMRLDAAYRRLAYHKKLFNSFDR